MDILTIILGVLFIVLLIYHIIYVNHHKPKTVGRIIVTDKDSMYIELKSKNSLEDIRNGKYVILEVTRQ